MIAARQPGAFFSNRLAFFSDATAFFSKNTVDDSLWFCCFWTPNTPKIPRRASRAGLLHFPIVLLVLDAKYPKNSPARFARRIASFLYSFACFGSQIPQKIPRRASRAGWLHFPMVLFVSEPKYPKIFPARFARRVASFPYISACSGSQIPYFSRRASRAGLLQFPMFLLLLEPKYCKKSPARFARRIA